ncbi:MULTISPECIES: hypothetical protein [unclassified Burkholderia]|uniref:hypothetical protein n=1 Tax=unclassified Burkholderia TaxID=2613784 RepID=UPI002AB0BF29|nr:MULTISPECIES: hypothetical protein [unclassified Burkholderia]
MTEMITVAIVAAIGGYAGSVYAFSRIHPRAPDATAQAYRDLLAALSELLSTFVDMSTARAGGQQPTDAMRHAMNDAGKRVSSISNSASFLLAETDLDLIDSISQIYTMDPDKRIEQLDKVINAVRQSAYQTYRRRS